MAAKRPMISKGGLYTLCAKMEAFGGHHVLKLFPLWDSAPTQYKTMKILTEVCLSCAVVYKSACSRPRPSKHNKGMLQVFSSIMNGEWVGIQLSYLCDGTVGAKSMSHTIGLATSNRKMIEMLKEERQRIHNAEIVRVDNLYKQDLMGLETTTTKEFLL